MFLPRHLTTVFALFLSVCVGPLPADFPREKLAANNVTWNSPSTDSRGSMPVGNGDIGLNAWVDPQGDLLFYIGKTDAWDNAMNLVKVGRVRVKFTPALIQADQPFQQTLELSEGLIRIETPQVSVRLWVDANHPVVQVQARSRTGNPIEAAARIEIWRTPGKTFVSGYRDQFPQFSNQIAPDTVLPAQPHQIGWYHQNNDSAWGDNLRLQKLDALITDENDPLRHRIFGAVLRGDNFAAENDTSFKTKSPQKEITLAVHVLTQVRATPEQWLATLEKQAAAVEAVPFAQRLREHRDWWTQFWSRSWIFLDTTTTASPLPHPDTPWRTGVDSQGGSKFAGAITDAQVLPRALSPEEIARLAATPRDGKNETAGADTPPSSAVTVAAWIFPAPGEQGRILDNITVRSADGMMLDVRGGDSLRWIVGQKNFTTEKCLEPRQWQHVAATADNVTGIRRIYLNGKLLKESDGRPGEAEAVNQGYTLQRFVTACGGRGGVPIKFNGSIFTADENPDKGMNADWRRWGGAFWFQNVRLPYWPLLQTGDFEMMQPLFRYYLDILPLRRHAVKTHYGHEGANFLETMTLWGTYLDGNYGVNRAGKPDGLSDNRHIRYYWQSGLELTMMMLDYYDYTQDTAFRDQTLLPLAREILAFYDQHWQRSAEGKIHMDPSQALECAFSAVNPAPDVAGLHAILPRLLPLTSDTTLKSAWQKMLRDLPPVPLKKDEKTGIVYLGAAEQHSPLRNAEKPAFYPVFPYRLYALTADPASLAIGRASTQYYRLPTGMGWEQSSIFHAMLGNAESARRMVATRFGARPAAGYRFPAFWGPHHDWTPDQNHNTVSQTALQRMLLQYEGDKILLLPAWPKAWNTTFRLHAPKNTVLTGVVRDGKLAELQVSPESRRKDITVLEAQ